MTSETEVVLLTRGSEAALGSHMTFSNNSTCPMTSR